LEHPLKTALRANIIVGPSDHWAPSAISTILKRHPEASFVCETCVASRNGWENRPALIFYTPVAHPQGSNWFAIQQIQGNTYISNGISAVETPITGVIAKNGDVIYSRYRHDYRVSDDGSVFIDGGRDYTKLGSNDDSPIHTVTLKIEKNKLVIDHADTSKA